MVYNFIRKGLYKLIQILQFEDEFIKKKIFNQIKDNNYQKIKEKL